MKHGCRLPLTFHQSALVLGAISLCDPLEREKVNQKWWKTDSSPHYQHRLATDERYLWVYYQIVYPEMIGRWSSLVEYLGDIGICDMFLYFLFVRPRGSGWLIRYTGYGDSAPDCTTWLTQTQSHCFPVVYRTYGNQVTNGFDREMERLGLVRPWR